MIKNSIESINEKKSKNVDFKGKISIDIKGDSDYIYVTIVDNGVGFKEVDKAKRIIEELKKAAKEGKGAAQLDGRMIDAASARMAENIVNINSLIESKK